MRSSRVLYNQPRMSFDSSSAPSASNLFSASTSFRGIGSLVELGLQNMWMASGIAASRRAAFPGRSGPITIVSSMYTSHFPESSAGMSTIVSRATEKGVESGSSDGLGNLIWMGEWSLVGSQSGQWSISVARSATGSDMQPQSLGQGLPPKVSRKAINRMVMPFMITCVNDLTAVTELRCWRR